MSVIDSTTSEQEPRSEVGLPEAAGVKDRFRDHAWVWQVTALSIGLGILLGLAVRTTQGLRDATQPTNRLGVSAAFLARYRDQNHRLQEELRGLRAQRDAYVAEAQHDNKVVEELNREFENLRASTGLDAVEGAGLVLTLRDSPDTKPSSELLLDFAQHMVHDRDINGVLAELKRAGARHLAITGADSENIQRVIVSTTARCVGPIAMVNGVPLSAPYRILVIGDPTTLRAALEHPDGYVRLRRLDERKMLLVEERNNLKIPEYSGTLEPLYAQPLTQPDAAVTEAGA